MWPVQSTVVSYSDTDSDFIALPFALEIGDIIGYSIPHVYCITPAYPLTPVIVLLSISLGSCTPYSVHASTFKTIWNTITYYY